MNIWSISVEDGLEHFLEDLFHLNVQLLWSFIGGSINSGGGRGEGVARGVEMTPGSPTTVGSPSLTRVTDH